MRDAAKIIHFGLKHVFIEHHRNRFVFLPPMQGALCIYKLLGRSTVHVNGVAFFIDELIDGGLGAKGFPGITRGD